MADRDGSSMIALLLSKKGVVMTAVMEEVLPRAIRDGLPQELVEVSVLAESRCNDSELVIPASAIALEMLGISPASDMIRGHVIVIEAWQIPFMYTELCEYFAYMEVMRELRFGSTNHLWWAELAEKCELFGIRTFRAVASTKKESNGSRARRRNRRDRHQVNQLLHKVR